MVKKDLKQLKSYYRYIVRCFFSNLIMKTSMLGDLLETFLQSILVRKIHAEMTCVDSMLVCVDSFHL